jgi:hypothetical protein
VEHSARTSLPTLLPLDKTDASVPYQGFVAIPKSVSQARIQENAQIFDFELDAEDMEQVRQDFPVSWLRSADRWVLL